MRRPAPTDPCPCGTGAAFASCCGAILDGMGTARTAEQLMRSRYTAYAVGDVDHVFRTWHPRSRPAEVTDDPAVRWTRLRITDVVGGGENDDTGEVEFVARSVSDGRPHDLHERSRFARRAGRWVYVDGDVLAGGDGR